jgi:hypothetical protein
MKHTLNEYYQLKFGKPNAPRIVVYPNNLVAASLLNYYKTNAAAVIALSDCLLEGTCNLPMPNDIFVSLNSKFAEYSGCVVVVAIDSYLSLLSKNNITAFWVAMQGLLDKAEANAVFMVCGEHYSDEMFPPHYSESRKIIRISGDFEVLEPPKINVISSKWLKSGDATDYKTLLDKLGNFLPTGEHTLVLDDLCTEQAGLSNTVSFLLDVKQIAEHFYDISADLPLPTLKALLTKANEKGLSPENYIESEFGSDGIDARFALKRLLELPDDDLWLAYGWLLQKRLPVDTYLAKVLSAEITYSNLLRKYVIDTAVSIQNDSNAQKFADERASAIASLPTKPEPLIAEFISHVKEFDSAIKFLNCGTTAERIELLRRVSKLELTMGLPKIFARLYPTLADYLTDIDYGISSLATYFKEYRKLKVKNMVTPEFVKKAYDTVLPAEIPTRELLLSKLRADDTALLIIDGMGAEYFSLLIAMARRYAMNVESASVASVKLPTSTDFNRIKWNPEHLLDEAKGVDNTAHKGDEEYERCTPEQNFEAVLRAFELKVFTRITNSLNKYPRVVVTADHGTSRLAVLAHNEGLATTLPWNGQPDDWRYSLAPAGKARPPEYEQQYFPESQKTYWVVRGYNRLPKSGGKLNELHGGASLEERLVPVVVFTRNASVLPQKQLEKKPIAEIVDEFEGII